MNNIFNKLKSYIVKNYKEKLQTWFNECDKNDVNDLDEFDLKNIASDFNIDLNIFKENK